MSNYYTYAGNAQMGGGAVSSGRSTGSGAHGDHHEHHDHHEHYDHHVGYVQDNTVGGGGEGEDVGYVQDNTEEGGGEGGEEGGSEEGGGSDDDSSVGDTGTRVYYTTNQVAYLNELLAKEFSNARIIRHYCKRFPRRTPASLRSKLLRLRKGLGE